MSKPTRTFNPLHFEDLDPKRFEDLVRQLAYDFRRWRLLEPTGRLGADDGIDIRAVEATGDIDAEDDDPDELPPSRDRLWIIQCKREKEVGPTKAERIADEGFSGLTEPPHGFVIAAACDFSKRTRDVFRDRCRAAGVREVYCWGKADIEDMLYQPKNDHLLFAYFGISFQVRKRTMKTALRQRLATKRAAIQHLGKIHPDTRDPLLGPFHGQIVLLRDPREERYPSHESLDDAGRRFRWTHAVFRGHSPPDHLSFVVYEHYAYVNDETQKWDAIFGHRITPPPPPEGAMRVRRMLHDLTDPGTIRSFWLSHVPYVNRAYITVIRSVHYDRVLAIDPDGDVENTCPHVFVEFDESNGPFEPDSDLAIRADERLSRCGSYFEAENRITFFPDDMRD